jgi:hypothetical protein
MKFNFFNKYINLTCEEASFLISKRQETKLTWRESLRLKFHISICEPCTRFAKQVVIMDASLAQFFSLNASKSQAFSAKKKEDLEKFIEENK